jgi:hypothetical protein
MIVALSALMVVATNCGFLPPKLHNSVGRALQQVLPQGLRADCTNGMICNTQFRHAQHDRTHTCIETHLLPKRKDEMVSCCCSTSADRQMISVSTADPACTLEQRHDAKRQSVNTLLRLIRALQTSRI